MESKRDVRVTRNVLTTVKLQIPSPGLDSADEIILSFDDSINKISLCVKGEEILLSKTEFVKFYYEIKRMVNILPFTEEDGLVSE